MLLQCPHCKQTCETEQELVVGQHVRCPFCNEKFEYSVREVVCPKCKCGLVLPVDVKDGQHIKCPSCDNKFSYRPPSRIELPLHKDIEDRKEHPNRVGGRAVSAECSSSNSTDVQVGVVKRLKNLLESKKYLLIVCGVVLVGGICSVTNRATESPLEKIRREFKEVNERTSHYFCSSTIEVDLSTPATGDGVFGLRWGERPRNVDYRVPCDVDYPISHGLYSRMKLMYDDNGGLIAVELHGPTQPVPDYSMVPMPTRADLEQQFVQDVCVPVFDLMRQLAEQILHQRMMCFRGVIQLTGMTGGEEDNGFVGVIRMDIRKSNSASVEGKRKDPEQIFMIMKKHH